MTQSQRKRVHEALDLRAREAVGFGNGPQTDPRLDQVVWLPQAGKAPKPNIFFAHRQYEGRLAA